MRFLATILLVAVFAAGITGASTDAFAKKKSQGNPKYASIVMDADTGMILRQSYADKSLHPASLTKMMTLMILFEYLDSKQITLRDRIPISKNAAAAPPSKLGLSVGSSIRVEDAIYALVTKSANDIAVAVAEFMAGSESRFASEMTKRARAIGMDRTLFRNASGLPDNRQVTTARDMARLARYILMQYPHHYHYFATKQFTYRGNTYGNHNKLMYSYKGMDGFKTGYINASGFNLVASAKRDGHRLIGVVFGGRTSKSRNAHMAEILDESFKRVGNVRVAAVPLENPPPPPARKPDITRLSSDALALAARAGGAPLPTAAPLHPDTGYTSLAALQTTKTKMTVPDTASDLAAERAAAINKSLESGAFSELIGQGDYDPAVSKRIETGLLAMAVHKGDYKPNPEPATAVENSLREVGLAMFSKVGSDNNNGPAPIKTASVDDGEWKEIYSGDEWAIQIGAYNSRVATDRALRVAQARLPQAFSSAKAVAVPLRTSEGVVFRARLAGLNKSEAQKACGYFKDCLTIAPKTGK